jgi:very-short-patch-repair endonuclease
LALRRGGGRGKEGSQWLEQLVNERDDGRAPTQSELEDRFMGMVRRRSLPRPVAQIPVLDPPADFGYPEAMLLYELDGRRWHGTVAAQRRDRRRDREARALGYELVRVLWEELVWEEDVVAEELLRLYQRRRQAA